MKLPPAADRGAPVWPRRKKSFLLKAAKSVSEIQSNVNNMADVLVFLEVLGYTTKAVREHGYRDMRDLARHVYEVIDYFDPRAARAAQPLLFQLPGRPRRLLQGFALSAPWLMMLPLLFVFGVSLWMDWRLPAPALTALALGVLLGMMVSEGHIWVYSRLLLFYHSQANVSETRRVVNRTYTLFLGVVTVAAGTLILTARMTGVPLGLAEIAAVAMITMSLHRFSFAAVYTLRKVRLSVEAYAGAIVLTLSIYFFAGALIPDGVTRYLVALGCGFLLLLLVAVQCTLQAYHPSTAKAGDAPEFFRPLFINEKTLRSSFMVQLWENASFYIYGASFMLMMFVDRIVSWFYNPIHSVGGVNLPLVFNAEYHAGADMALFVVFPMGVIQYVMVGHVFEMLHNLALETPATEPGSIDKFLRRRYFITLAVTVLISGAIAGFFTLYAPSIINLLNGAPVSISILRIAAFSNVFLGVFIVNSSFVMVLNRPKVLATIALLSAFVVGVGGFLLGRLGFQDIVFAYLCSCVLAAVLSSVKLAQLMPRASSLFLSRF